MEAEVIQAALKVLHAERPRLLDLELTEAAGYLCSGHLRIYPEPALLIVRDNLSVRGVADYDRGRVFEKRTAGLRGV